MPRRQNNFEDLDPDLREQTDDLFTHILSEVEDTSATEPEKLVMFRHLVERLNEYIDDYA
jgi:hypothetical protein